MTTLLKLPKVALPAPTNKRGGRKAGQLNLTTVEMREAAQKHGAEALETILTVMRTSLSETARLSAADLVLDRAYGKSKVPLEIEPMRIHNISMTQEEMDAACKRLLDRY